MATLEQLHSIQPSIYFNRRFINESTWRFIIVITYLGKMYFYVWVIRLIPIIPYKDKWNEHQQDMTTIFLKKIIRETNFRLSNKKFNLIQFVYFVKLDWISEKVARSIWQNTRSTKCWKKQMLEQSLYVCDSQSHITLGSTKNFLSIICGVTISPSRARPLKVKRISISHPHRKPWREIQAKHLYVPMQSFSFFQSNIEYMVVIEMLETKTKFEW